MDLVYFDEQKLTEIIKSVETIDVVVTHTRPSVFPPFILNHTVLHYARTDSKLLSDLTAETALVQKVYDFLLDNNKRPSKWVYGHFHYSESYEVDGCVGNILGIDEFKDLVF